MVVSVRNTTGYATGPFTVEWRTEIDGEEHHVLRFPAMDQNTTTHGEGFSHTFTTSGDVRWAAQADVFNAVQETDETNNVLTGRVTVQP
jgi:hypothetical protein